MSGELMANLQSWGRRLDCPSVDYSWEAAQFLLSRIRCVDPSLQLDKLASDMPLRAQNTGLSAMSSIVEWMLTLLLLGSEREGTKARGPSDAGF